MALHPKIAEVTEKIKKRSVKTRGEYLNWIGDMRAQGVARAHLSCGNQAHAYAAMTGDKKTLTGETAPNIGIITAYNDMLSAHQPFAEYPDKIKEVLRDAGATAQVAAGVPAMCDGITQGQPGMELSLFSRDAIAMSAAIGLSHNCFDAALYLGVCDKIVPGLVLGAARFGHLPSIFVPAGPMRSGIANDKKAQVRRDFAEGKCDRKTLMAAEMASYHSPGTCSFYGTANTNQMLMEFMGLHLPGASFVNPDTPLRAALTREAALQAARITDQGNSYRPVGHILSEKAYVNGIVGLMATGGSTNLLIHLIAMARASGVILDWSDFAEVSDTTPLLARVYPNGLADVNHFHAAGGLSLLICELLNAGLLHDDTDTIMGKGLSAYTQEPKLIDDKLQFVDGPKESQNNKIVASVAKPFAENGGLASFDGNMGKAVMKISAVDPQYHQIKAPVRIFHDQQDVIDAFRAGEFTEDVVVVVRYQGPKANGMPELHSLTPCLSVLLGRGIKVALVTDGRMSGASGKVPSAIHASPEALDNGPIAQLQDGDIVSLDATTGELEIENDAVLERPINHPDLSKNTLGLGRDMFQIFRDASGPADQGASVFTFSGA
ncbi:MAG: phosphogluconate dehydratase [Pseudomonadota bacterium]